jgi:acetolactate synthase-1/2/3 large subunit
MSDPILISNLCTDLTDAINFCNDFSNFGKHPPLVVLGEELIHQKNNDFIKSFILKTGSFVALTPNSKGVFDNRHPRYLGLIGIMGHSYVNEYLEKTEHLILVGVNFDLLNRTGMLELMSTKKVLIIKEEKSSSLFNFPSEKVSEAYGDYEEIFSNIIPHCLTYRSKLPVLGKSISDELSTDLDFNYKAIINTIRSIINKDANIFIDAGNSGAFVIHHLEASRNNVFHVSLGMGGMGNSIGAGIGSAIASQKKSYVFLGDGSFLMHGLEIHTAMEYDLPIVFFIFNNNSHGMCSTRENVFLDGETGINNFKESKFAEGINKLFPGIVSHEVNDLDLLKKALIDNNNSNSPCVLSINIKNSESPPFITFYKN